MMDFVLILGCTNPLNMSLPCQRVSWKVCQKVYGALLITRADVMAYWNRKRGWK